MKPPNDPHFLTPDGKEKLKVILEESDDPMSFIESLHHCEHYDFSQYSKVFQIGDFSGFDASRIFEKYIEQQHQTIKNKISTLYPDQLKELLKQLQQYSDIPIFHDLIKDVLARMREVPKWFEIPESIKSDLSPPDQLRVFSDQPKEFKLWLESVFNESMCNFQEVDDFSYLHLFQQISEFCFHKRQMYQIVVNFCEKKFLETYHPIYCVIRIRLSLYNSPLSRIDSARPLSYLVTKAVSGDCEVNFTEIEKAATVCGASSQIVLSLPNFTMKYPIKDYIKAFGVTPRDKMIWSKHLNTGNSDAVDFMKRTPFFARIIGISVIQGIKLNGDLFITLKDCQPQCDVAYFMCRRYKTENDSILREWASKSGSVFIDYLTLCISKKMKLPDIQVPELTKEQEAIYNAFLQK